MDDRATPHSLAQPCAVSDPALLAPTVRDFSPPRQVAHPNFRLVAGYAILEEIGEGGMGLVFKARQLQLDRLVALKMLRPGWSSRDDLLRFRTEGAEAVAHLIHPGIVQIHEIGEHEGHPFISLEYVAGGSLDQHLGGTPMPAQEAARLVHTLAETMEFAHRNGVIHRDLKPANILMQEVQNAECRMQNEKKGQKSGFLDSAFCTLHSAFLPKITDFGLAKRLDGTGGHTRDGEVIGTPAYMSPEQAEGSKDVGPAADIYALGAILYECLTGRAPFAGESFAEILRQVREEVPVLPRRFSSGIPHDLETICLKCLRKTAADRYATAANLAEDLRRFLTGEPIRARATGHVERIWKWAGRRPAAAGLALVSAFFIMALLAAGPIHLAGLHSHDVTRRSVLETDCLRHLQIGRVEVAEGKLDKVQSAEVHFATARESISDADAAASPPLARLRDEAITEQIKATRLMTRLLGVEPARKQLRQLEKARDEASFHLHRDLLGVSDPDLARACLEAGRTALKIQPDHDCLGSSEGDAARALRQEVLLIVVEAMVQLDSSPKELHKALVLLDEAEQTAGPCKAVSLRRARYLAMAGDRGGAASARRRAKCQPARDGLDFFLIAQERWLAGDLRPALDDLERVLRLQPGHFWARMLRAAALQRLGQNDEARAELTLCIQARPDFAWPYLLRAPLWLSVTQGARRTRSDLDAAARLPLDRSARYLLEINRGVLALELADYRSGVRAFQHAVLLWPRRFHGHANLAEAYWRGGQHARALASLDHALRLAPAQEHPGLYRARSRMHALQGDLHRALSDIETVLTFPSARAATLQQQSADLGEKARLLYRLRRYEEALIICAGALKGLPEAATLWRLHAEIMLELGRPREALAGFEKYLKHGKPDVEFYRRRIRARAVIGDTSGIIDDFTLALAIHRDASLFAGRGWAHLTTGGTRLALGDFNAALELQPEDGDARIGKATALLDLGQTETALAEIERVLKQARVPARVLYNAARVLARIKPSQARQARRIQERTVDVLRRAVEAVPENDRSRFWTKQVCRDEAFRSLKTLSAFGNLQAELFLD